MKIMKRKFQIFGKTVHFILIFAAGASTVLLFHGCEKQDVYDNPNGPVIQSIYPEEGKAGITLYIYGENFSPAIQDNDVSIGETELLVYKADSTVIEAIIPQGLKSGSVKVSVKKKAYTGPFFTYLSTVSVETFAGSGLVGLQDGSAGEARFNTPRAVAIDGSGNLYVADQENHAIRKITKEGQVTTLAGDGIPGFTDGAGAHARFRQPGALVWNTDGNLYVADFGNNAIRRVSLDGMVTTIAGDSIPGYADGFGNGARFWGPAGIVSAPSGNLYVADFLNSVIRLVTPDGYVSTYAGTGQPGFADGDRLACQFAGPAGIAVGPQNNIYISDWGNFKVRKMSPDGYVSTLAGSTQGYADGQGSNAMFNTPYATTVDADGNIYVADGFNNLIRKIDPQGNVTTLAGNTSAGYQDGSPGNARFNGPVGVIFDTLNTTLYVSEYYNHRIRQIRIR